MNRWGQTGTNEGHVHPVPTGDGQGHPPKGVSPVPADQITLDRPAVKAGKLHITQARAMWEKVLAEPEVFGARDYIAKRSGEEFWLVSQQVKPIVRKRVDWRAEMCRTLDRWSGKTYIPGRAECFLFACEALDAMLGTQFYQRHFKKWNTITAFYPYCRAIGGLDYFDCAGVRIAPEDAQPGDLIQEEMEATKGKLHVHWGIASDMPNRHIMFGTYGLTSEYTSVPCQPTRRMKAWRLLDPIAKPAVRDGLVPMPPISTGGPTGRSTVPFSLPKKSGGKFDG